ncbi:hypothetical protein JNUCC0626_20895 [Lentzea sp. JNUCC 0626]|uniref:hypothetical protein n=1 Tax=Lentzea sp. JNUCC 0626 TaxID=3367513 RepID=UPI003748F0BA
MAGRVMLLVPLFALVGCGSTPTVSDAAVVYCTTPARQSETLAAAKSLRLVDSTPGGNQVVVGGKTLSFDEWREQRRADFVKACTAFADPVVKPASSGTPAWLSTLLTVLTGLFSTLAGAWVAWFSANRREDRTRGKHQAVALRTASTEFVAAVREYGEAWQRRSPDGTQPSAAALLRKRDVLANQFAVTTLLWPAWTAPGVLRAEAMAFGDGVESGWGFDRDRTELKPRAQALNDKAAVLDRRVEVLARALERPADAEKLFAAEFAEAARP